MSNPFVSQLTPKNPREGNQTPLSEASPAVGKGMDAECGYAVLDRADPTSFDRSRRGLAPRAYEGPNIPIDEE